MSIQRLLDIRLEELKQDVAKVGRAVDVAAQRHQLVRTMKDYLHIRGAQSVVGPLHRARLALGTLQELLWQDDPETASLLQDNGVDLEEIIIDLERVASGLLTTQHALEKAETRVELTDAMQDALKGNLKACAEIILDIEDVQQRLRTEVDMPSLWREVDKLVAERCDPLFADYVDFLGGLTLRDNQFDEQVGAITDKFVQQLGSRRLAVPARGPAQRSVMEVLMKLGFPEWTLWDVPMAAYEVGMRDAVDAGVAKRLLARSLSGRNEEQEKVLFADVWAAYTAGPAYACANVLLRLRPHRGATATRPADVDRAYVIFELLARVQPEGEFAVDVNIVRACWASAAAELTGTELPSDAEALSSFVAEVHTRLTTEVACFGPPEWEEAVERLRPSFGRPEGASAAVYGGPVVNLLNAAWSAWLREVAAPSDIEQQALQAWRRSAPGGRPAGVRPIAGRRHGRR